MALPYFPGGRFAIIRFTGGLGVPAAVGWMLSKVAAAEQTDVESNDLREVPTYDELLVGACKHLDAYEDGATVVDCEEC